MRNAWVLLVMVAGSAMAASAMGQHPGSAKGSATGTLSGHVYCGDTNAPARMATVLLEPAAAVDGNDPEAKDSEPIHASSVQTLLDGSFSVQKLAPGAYYVIASMPGYVSPFAALKESMDSIRNPDKAMKEKFAKSIPRVVVQANLPATIEIRLERGAAISGSVRYDDGSPAVGLTVHPLLRKKGQKEEWTTVGINGFQYAPEIVTDDQGNYRIGGLAAGEYIMEADLTLTKVLYDVTHQGGGTSVDNEYSLPVYSGDSFRKRNAASFELKLGETRAGEDLQIPLSKLHGLNGTLIASRDGHVVNGGSVALLNADDRSEALTTKLTKDSTTFQFQFVPEGDYLLRPEDAKDVEYQEISNGPGVMPPTHTEQHTVHTYGSADTAVHIEGETSGVIVSVPERQTAAAAPHP